jgi:hypothetical protein
MGKGLRTEVIVAFRVWLYALLDLFCVSIASSVVAERSSNCILAAEFNGMLFDTPKNNKSG